MGWIVSSGLLIEREKGTVFYPWEYRLQWDIANHEIALIDSENDVISRCYDYEMSYNQFCDWQEESKRWQDLQVEIDSDVLPGSSTFRLVNSNLTNGTVSFKLAKCELSDVDDNYFGLTCNGVRYLIKSEGDVQQYLGKLIKAFSNAIREVAPASEDTTPGSSDFLRFTAWIYCFLCIAGGFFLAKEGAVAVGIGIGVSSFLVLAFALAISSINENLHRFLAGRK